MTAPLPSLWDCLAEHGIPREYRSDACAALLVWLKRARAISPETFCLQLHATNDEAQR